MDFENQEVSQAFRILGGVAHIQPRIILDEIHSIGQQEGGAVWEQIILLAPCPIMYIGCLFDTALRKLIYHSVVFLLRLVPLKNSTPGWKRFRRLMDINTNSYNIHIDIPTCVNSSMI